MSHLRDGLIVAKVGLRAKRYQDGRTLETEGHAFRRPENAAPAWRKPLCRRLEHSPKGEGTDLLSPPLIFLGLHQETEMKQSPLRVPRRSHSDKVFRMQPVAPQNLKRKILKDALRENETRDASFRRIIRSVPNGKVSTYGKVAAAAGYPLYHRAVARLLRKASLQGLPWQRIVGAGGEIKLRGEAGAEQRLRLSIEGVKFRGRRVNMEIYEHTLRSWETLK
jgi:methylated-DNA-protein-cysteine methyltransferase related protein